MPERRNSNDGNQTKIHRNFSVLLASTMLMVAILACETVVTDPPFYTCPTVVPSTAVPEPTVLPRTPLPFPTLIPPPPTPYSITPPQNFYVGNAVFVGQSSSAALSYTDFDALPLEIEPLSSLLASVGYLVPDTLQGGRWIITEPTGNSVSFRLSFDTAPLNLHYDGVDVRLVSVTYIEGQITTHMRIYNGRSETLPFTQDDIWLALGYAPEPPGPRNPAEGLTPFELLPEQAVDLRLVWYWGGEAYASMRVGEYRFGIQVIGSL